MPEDATRSKHIVHKEGSEPMLPPTKMRDWARHLLAHETDAATDPALTESPAILVYEKLRRDLSPLVGADGFQVLAARALKLAKANDSRLGAAQITAEGDLRGFGDPAPQSEAEKALDSEAGAIFIAHLFGVFLTLLGPETTRRLVENAFPCIGAATEPGITTPFENMLKEVTQLRSVSERLETLAGEHPGVGDGLAGISGNIRDIATILDVFAVIKRRAEGQDQGNRMNII
jgi:hypothetical protein